MRTLSRLVVWILLAGLAFITLSPIGMRPALGPGHVERALAYGVFGLVAAMAYPRRRLGVLVGVVIVAGLLEYAQGFTASRHGRLADFLVKAGGGTAGWLAARVLMRAGRRPEGGS